ncbi:hypothetical protein [Hymenobacter jeollabukensis]|uniref:Uncharacterized protein n=1 Tax=Hymenobacter jeollabukensis TaxID=2025313 RepID=A0A5R8WJ29_9BACT|nr:hypothetical protein [Hymenobacter jeollabukensis]TLM88897.1 hypothetical protein FDY95_22200 [Hymenobacter jeollabukensis]
MNASEAPVFGEPNWNRYRTRVAEMLTDVEADMQQRGYGLSLEGLTLEVAERLSLGVATLEDFQVLEALVKALRPVAREAVRTIREQQGGQFALLLL